MASNNLAVLNALDTARTQYYHVTAIVIAGMGFFTDAYDLFCISTISKLLGHHYYYDPSKTFWLGFGIGGDYPLSATIMSEYANKKTRGAFVAAVFAMQGVGIIFAGLVSMTLSRIFLAKFEGPAFHIDPVLSTEPEADFMWRIVLMLGALPALLT
ncbi:hypothetical protein ACSBR2_008460 [Camellia fascicularis]